MSRQCTCVRCSAEEFVRGIYPKMDDHRVLQVATEIVKALHSSVAESRRSHVLVGGVKEKGKHNDI